jgi:hypothetical protein
MLYLGLNDESFDLAIVCDTVMHQTCGQGHGTWEDAQVVIDSYESVS